MRQGVDTPGAWIEDPRMGVRELTGNQLADVMRDAAFNPELRMQSLYKTLAVVGQETIGARPAHAVLATPAQGSATRMYFDTEAGLLVRRTMTQDSPQGPINVDMFIEDYRDVEGVTQPFTIRQVAGMSKLVIRLTEITHDVALDDAIFRRTGAPLAPTRQAVSPGDLKGLLVLGETRNLTHRPARA